MEDKENIEVDCNVQRSTDTKVIKSSDCKDSPIDSKDVQSDKKEENEEERLHSKSNKEHITKEFASVDEEKDFDDLVTVNQSDLIITADDHLIDRDLKSFGTDDETIAKVIETIEDEIDKKNLDKDDDDDEDDDTQLTNWEKQKILKIYEAIREDNVEQLVHYCDTNGGLLSNRIRQIVWPKILKSNIIGTYQLPDEEKMQAHFYYRQVVLDVDRSIKRFPPSIKESQRLAMQDQLVRLIMRLLIRNSKLHYYQGFHDICVTILIILGEESAFHAMHSLVNSHLPRFMEKTTDSVAFILELIPVLIQRKDQPLYEFLERSEVGNIYCLSWVLTWFGHSLTNYRHLGRLFDLFIVNHELFSVYLVASILLYKRDQIMELDCCISEVYPYLNRLIEVEEDQLPFEDLIENARVLLREYPPELMHKEQQKRVKRKQEQDRLHRKKVANKNSISFIDRRLVIAATICVASVALFFVAKGISNHLK